MRVLVDGDILAYRCGFAAQKGRGDDVEAEPVENALHNVNTVVESIISAVESDDVCVYLSGGENYRFDIATERPYKGNRDGAPKPVHYAAILKHIKKQFPHQVSDGQEADDDLGIAQTVLTKKYIEPGNSVIVTIDKDLDMIPGNHYNFVKDMLYHVEENEAWLFFYKQLVTGDTTDNIPGIPGKGPRAAEKLLEGVANEVEAYERVRGLYVQAFTEKHADEALLEQARLLWIRRYEDELWSPPNDS